MAFDAEEFMRRALANPSEPARRRNKQRSGRQSRKQAQSAAVMRAVGGTDHLVRAIYGGNDHHDEPEAWNKDLCVVADRDLKVVTTFSNPEYHVPEGQWMGRVGCV